MISKEDTKRLEIFLYKSGYTTPEVGVILGLKTAKVSNDLKREMVEMRSASESRKKKKLAYGDFPSDIQALFGLYTLNKEALIEFTAKNPAPRKPITLNRATNLNKADVNKATVVEMRELSDSLIKNILSNTELGSYNLVQDDVSLSVKNSNNIYVKVTTDNQQDNQELLKDVALNEINDAKLVVNYAYDNEFEDMDFLNKLFTYTDKLTQYVGKKFPNLNVSVGVIRKKLDETFNVKIEISNK